MQLEARPIDSELVLLIVAAWTLRGFEERFSKPLSCDDPLVFSHSFQLLPPAAAY
jgi:hypothetical protein